MPAINGSRNGSLPEKVDPVPERVEVPDQPYLPRLPHFIHALPHHLDADQDLADEP